MNKSNHMKALGELFRVCRAEVPPSAVCPHVITSTVQRRVPGLRREEVAQLALVSADYYTRVEQGRLVPSDPVFDVLCRILALSEEQRAYAKDLLNRARGFVPPMSRREAAHGRLQLLLDQLDSLPAFVLGPRMQVLAWNAGASELITDFTKWSSRHRNYVEIIFTDPETRTRYEDWPGVAQTCVGILRREAAENPDDPELAALVGRLSIASNEFRLWWAEHRVAEQDFGAKVLIHPTYGRIRVNWDSFTYSGAEGQQLVLWSADTDTPDAAALANMMKSANAAQYKIARSPG